MRAATVRKGSPDQRRPAPGRQPRRGFGALFGAELGGDLVAAPGGPAPALLGGARQPDVGAHQVAPDAPAVAQQVAQVLLRPRVALLGVAGLLIGRLKIVKQAVAGRNRFGVGHLGAVGGGVVFSRKVFTEFRANL